MKLFSEFKPALKFLGKFLAIYLIGNIAYGFYLKAFGNEPDAVTHLVSAQLRAILNLMGYAVETSYRTAQTITLNEPDAKGLTIYEGCNGINVGVTFLAFIVAFGGRWARMAWFIPLGLACIHLTNLGRLLLLFLVVQYRPAYFYYLHKYFFTAIIYVMVFGLWALWVGKVNGTVQLQTSKA